MSSVDRLLPEHLYDSALQQEIKQYVDAQIKDVNVRLDVIEAPVSGAATQFQASPNLIPNSHPEWSKMAWTTAAITPGTAGDTNYEAYNWYYHLSTATEMVLTGPLLGSGHSGFAGLNADAPAWDRVNGNFNIGASTTNRDIAAPLPTDFVFPGQKFYIYFEAALLQTDTDIDDVEFYCGFWDNTAGQRKWIEGGDFTPTLTVYGVPGARTLEYKILAETDAGTQILSVAISTAIAPATLTENNHVRLSFTGAPGFIRYTVYRKDGANFYRVGEIRNSTDLQFFDIQETGSSVVPVSGYPSVTANRPQAYAVTTNLTPAPLGSFRAHTMAIQVPLTYNRSLTGNLMQWFRFGLTSLVASGSEREVVIRRISVSDGYGGWARSSLDLQALSGPTSTAASAPGGGGGVGGGPPEGGGGGPVCLVLDTHIETPDGTVLLNDLEKGDWTLCGAMASQIKQIQIGTVQFVWEIETDCGRIVKCSDDHKWPTSFKDRRGRAARFLKVGDTLINKEFKETIIRSKVQIFPTEQEMRDHGGILVKRIWLPHPHLFIANELVTLNLKPID
jgi:hypothetical protein